MLTFFEKLIKKIKCSFLFGVFILSISLQFNSANAQEFGGNPAKTKWRQINTDTARIIYPVGLKATAQRVANVLHEMQKTDTNTVGSTIRKVDVVLQNQGTLSNAYVALGPFRSEFFMTAPQNSFDFGSVNWADNLAIHEYRHVQQYANYRVGISKVMSIIFGQEGQAVANGMAVPDWFFEGDAVFVETGMTRQGRGRFPDFFNGYKSLHLANRNYSFMKLRNGSFRHFVPSHYDLGYLLTAYGRKKFGPEVWKNVSINAAAYKPLVYPWQGAFKNQTGQNYKKFVDESLEFYKQQWNEKAEGSYITKKNENYRIDYKYPYRASDGALIVLKRSYRHIPALYKIKADGTEERITTRDIDIDDYFSYRNQKIVYSRLKPDTRWGNQDFSDIILYDIETGERKKLTQQKRYFSPDISEDGQKIVAVEMSQNLQSGIVVLDLNGKSVFQSGKVDSLIYTYPKFSANGLFVYSAVRNYEGEMALLKTELSSGKKQVILPFSNRVIGFPSVQNDTVFFSATNGKADEVWAFLEQDGQIYRVATHPTGLYHGAYQNSDGKLVAGNFTAFGNQLIEINRSGQFWQKIELASSTMKLLYVEDAYNNSDSSFLQKIPDRGFEESKYKKSFGLLNFHSWRPAFEQPDYSLTVFSQNILNTLQGELNYTYNSNESSHRFGANAIYGGWYVQPAGGVNYTLNRSVTVSRDTSFQYNELNANAGARLPLNFSGGRMFRFLTLSSSLNTQQVRWTGPGKNLLRDQSFNFLQARAVYSSQVQKALQHIFPRFGTVTAIQYRTIINNYTARQFLASGALYLPGLHRNHNLVLTGAFQGRDTLNQYFFSNSFAFSRGYRSVDFPRMWKLGANYHLPLVYPDWGFGNIVYFLRTRVNLFYDFTKTKSLRTGNKFYFNTVGAEIYFDTKWWNQQDVSFGIRYSHLLNSEFRGATLKNQWEIILPVDLF